MRALRVPSRRLPDILSQVEQIYATNRFWPEPLISINPNFERGASVADLAADGSLRPDTTRVFRVDGQPIRFHRHQAQAIAKATQRQSFAVTTGTGSGKSLCFFVPIIDAAIRARAAGETARTRAIVIYPMNALANSQMKELEKFIEQSGLPQKLLPTFARYTGQESTEERERDLHRNLGDHGKRGRRRCSRDRRGPCCVATLRDDYSCRWRH
jgi:ATP-dependent helicase YprA (DUF1998 family)